MSLYLFARVAETSLAFRSEEVDAVVRLNQLSPVPGVSRHVAGLAALRSRVLTVIDVGVLVLGDAGMAEGRNYAIVCDISGHSYGMLVDEVVDICEVDAEPLPLRGRVDPAWKRHASGVVLHNGRSSLLVSLENFIENGALSQAA